DIVNEKFYFWEIENEKEFKTLDVPEEYKEEVKKYREILIEQLTEIDDVMLEKYLHGQKIENTELMASIRKATLTCKYFPVFCGTSFKNKGVQPLLDGVVNFLPAPTDLESVKGFNPETKSPEERKHVPEESFAGYAFKIQTDPYVGRLVFVRIYSGILKSGSSVYNVRKNKVERISRLLRMHANNREEIKEGRAGDIVGVIGTKETITGDTICDRDHPIVFEQMHFPEPVVWIAVEPKTKADQEQLSYALNKLAEEDPTFKIKIDEETSQTIISGMGELHLEIIVDRLRREFNVDAKVGKPQVAYRETILKKVEVEGKYIKQSGGRGQYGHVWFEIEPHEGFEFVDKTKGGSIPHEYISPIEKGVKEAMESGPLIGYPLINMKVTLTDGSYHEVDSSEIAFKMAASMALQNGTKKADPVLLEPIMSVESVTPEDYIGDIMSELNARRGKISSIEHKNNLCYIKCSVPLSDMFGYATTIRSLSQGRASYTMEPLNYEKVPKNITEQLMPKTTS
ncbi:MAG: translation elongation factor G, partial [Gammaproteobacteria bacterium RIFOXYB2_FULL_38_6]